MSALTDEKFDYETPNSFEPGEFTMLPTSRADIAVRVSTGEGSAILLIHEIGSSSAAFDELFHYAFAADHRLVAVDLPGHGRSGEASDHETAYSFEGFAETLLETLERLDIESAFVVDRSRDGRIGLELMTIFPGMVGLAIVGGPFRGAVGDSPLDSVPVYEISSTSEEALEPVIQSIELREAALSSMPRLWYGG